MLQAKIPRLSWLTSYATKQRLFIAGETSYTYAQHKVSVGTAYSVDLVIFARF